MALDTSLLAQADRAHVIAALSKIRSKSATSWLGVKHPASRGQLPTKWPLVDAIPASKVIDAVAVTIPTHCMDGWSFAARALSALLMGDPHAARHMAYYAQLRAALCIMANLGVGIFNGINFAVDATGAIIRIDPTVKASKQGLGTHTIVWEAIQSWGTSATQSQLFLDLITFRHIPVRDVLEEFWPGFAATTTVSSLIAAWGVDLQRAQDDHHFRNTSSYAPHSLNPLTVNSSTNLRFVSALWRLFEPSSAFGFDALDRHLLRRMLREQHRLSGAGGALTSSLTTQAYDRLDPSVRNLCSYKFLTGASEPHTPELLRYAEAKAKPATPIQMLARALMLLRTATAFTHSSLRDAMVNVANGELTPWMTEVSAIRGFSPASVSPVSPSDLWEDTAIALRELAASKKAGAAFSSWRGIRGNGAPTIVEAERIAIGSFCP